MKSILSNTIRIEEPTEEMLDWCKMNLTLPNPEYEKKVRMGFWVGSTPSVLKLYEKHGDTLILPYGTLRSVFPILLDGEIADSFKPAVRVDYNGQVPLYDYQEKALNECYDHRTGILKSPAGSGKTQIGIALIMKWGRKALWLTHTKDLLKQSRDRALQYIDPSLIGTITEGEVNIGAGVTFATIQTMCRLDLAQYKDEWDVIIVDECHRVAGSPTAMTRFYKVLNSLAARHKYGLSATVHRADGMIAATYAILGQVIYTVPEEAVAGRVMKVGVRAVNTETKIDGHCLNTDGTLNYTGMISSLSENDDRNQCIANCIEIEWQHPCLILSDRLEHLKRIKNLLPDEMQARCAMVSGKTRKEERNAAIEDMRTGRKDYLFATYSLAKEGLDIPRLERLFLTTPQKDYAIITQSIGRIARTSDGKQDPIAYDFVDNIGYTQKAYRDRVSIYKKNGCYFVEGQVSG